MYKTTSILALGLFLSLAPQAAIAQTQSDDQLQIQQDTGETTTQDQATQSGDTATEGETVIEQQATDEPESMDADQQATDEPETMDTEEQATDEPKTMDTEEQATDEPETMDTEEQAAGADEPEASEAAMTGQIAEQKEGTFLSSSLLGEDVLSPDGESIGTISDLILTEDGELQGVVIGVGGFLGIGEKRIAIGMGSIEVRPSMDDPDQTEIVSDQTREQLEEGVAFKTLADIRAEEEAARAEQEAQQAQPEPAPAE